jgi:dihydropyrimidinase
MIGMLYSEGVNKGRLSVERLALLVSENPARIFGMYPSKGAIAVGSDADLCIVDPLVRHTVQSESGHGASDFEVFEGFEARGWPIMTVSRGDVVFEEGSVGAPTGRGRPVHRHDSGRPR